MEILTADYVRKSFRVQPRVRTSASALASVPVTDPCENLEQPPPPSSRPGMGSLQADQGSRYGMDDGVLGIMLDEYLQEVKEVELRSFPSSSAAGLFTGTDISPPALDSTLLEADGAPSPKAGPSTKPRQRLAQQQDWTPSDGSEDSSPHQKRPAARKKNHHCRSGRLSSRPTELQEKNRQAQQRFRQRQRVRAPR